MDSRGTFRTQAPAEFICPISLELMRDPVTACTGVTYDRSSIEKWLDKGHDTCPATMQTLENHNLVPNHALRRLIHSWCAANAPPDYYTAAAAAAAGNTSPIDRQYVQSLLEIIRRDPKKISALKKLKIKAKESVRNSRCILEAGAVPVLASVLCLPPLEAPEPPDKFSEVCEEAIAILALLPTSDATRRTLVAPRPLKSIAWILRKGSPQGKLSAIVLLDSLATDKGSQIAIGSTEGVIEGLVALLQEKNSNQMLVNSSLRAMLSMCLPTRNRIKAAEAGAVAALIELLPDTEGGVAEHVLIVLELLCGCNEGRSIVTEHALAIPAVVKKILRVSDSATDYAIGILWSVCKNCPKESIRDRTRGLGLFGKLLLLLRRELSPSTRHKVIDILDKVYNARMNYFSGDES